MSFNQSSLNKLGLGGGQIPLAGAGQFGTQTGEAFQQGLNNWRQLTQGMTEEEKKTLGPQLMQSLFPSADENIVSGFVNLTREQMSPEYQERMLEMADKYQTRKGVRQTAFNMFGSGFDNLMKGVGMSMNPYGTPEGLQNYLALTVAAPQAMSEGYRNLRTPMSIPAVQAPGAPTYF
jgi:hypothetical protein